MKAPTGAGATLQDGVLPAIHHPAIALVSWKVFRTSSSFMTVTVGVAYARCGAVSALRCVILFSCVSVMGRLCFDQLNHLERLELLQGALDVGLDIGSGVCGKRTAQRGCQ